MKRMFFAVWLVVLLGISQLFSTHLTKRYYFPECQIQVAAPGDWYVRNSTQRAVGMLFISKEEIVGIRGKFVTGLSIYSNFQIALKKEIKDTDSFAKLVFPGLINNYKTCKTTRFELETGVGKFRFLEIDIAKIQYRGYAVGVLKNEKGAFKVVIEGTASEWKTTRPMLLDMVRSIKLRSSGRPGDQIVYSNMEHMLTKRYAQHDNRLRKKLLDKFDKLRLGMHGKEYWRIMDYSVKKKNPGWKIIRRAGSRFTQPQHPRKHMIS